DRVLVVGDAGGFVNGFTAEGIYYAMLSGLLAAEAILEGRPLTFEAAWRREFGGELRDSVRVQRYVFADSTRVDAMVRGARRYPSIAAGLVDYAMGERSYEDARWRLISRLPLVAARLVVGAQRSAHGSP
ncbi:MAG: NAD(P)/FAD-dependent oxidoreductase, partial [Vicinamibacterales bacterium]